MFRLLLRNRLLLRMSAQRRKLLLALMSWTRHAVIYNIFVDRFARGRNDVHHQHELLPWGSSPTRDGFMGGNLPGIVDRLDYLVDLGVTIVSLTPIFMSSSNHRYNTYDYFRIDPRVGSMDDFQELLEEAHRRDIRVLLDGVFNHCGRGFYPFFDVMENGAASSYRDWFFIEAFPVEAYRQHRYRACLNTPLLPEFNLANHDAREYMLNVAEFWTRQGIDGWRFDAVPHVQHLPFWAALRQRITRVNPQAYLMAEIWGDASAWLNPGYFHAATNYPLRELILEFALSKLIRPSQLTARLQELASRYSWSQTLAMCNLIGSHDTVRLWTAAAGNIARIKLALFLLFFFPGIPSIFYGDEIGLEGGTDPENRGAMDWRRCDSQHELFLFLKMLIAARKKHRSLQEGHWHSAIADDASGLCVLLRRFDDEWALLIVSRACNTQSLSIDLGRKRVTTSPPRLSRMAACYRAREATIEVGNILPDSALLIVFNPRADEPLTEVASVNPDSRASRDQSGQARLEAIGKVV